MNNATSKVDLEKKYSPLHLPLKPDEVFKKQGASKFPIHSQDKVNRLLKILKPYKIISRINKKQQSKGSTYKIQ